MSDSHTYAVKKVLPFLLLFAAAGSVVAAPVITSINPSSCVAGSPQFTLTVNGSGFDNTSKVQWNGAALTTTFVNAGQVTAIVPAVNVAVAGTANVTVKNSTGPVSNTVVFTINNPVPTITSLNPSSWPAGCGQFTMTVNGTNFVTASTVRWNGTALATTYVSSTQLTATVTAALVASPGTASVTVVNPAPGGGTSNAVTFTITVPPAPVITSPLAATGTVGTAFSYQITATNCPSSYNATPLPPGLTVNTSTGLISGTPTVGGVYSVTISATNAGGTGSATLVITVNNLVPTITTISPASAIAGGPQFTLTVNGTNFVSGSTVKWNGIALTTTYVSATQLTATVPAALIATAGTASVTVVNPSPGGGTSNAVTFTINNPVPTTTSINPACATAGGPQFTLTVTGTNFVSTSTVRWGGTSLATTFVSSTQLTATVPASLIATAGTASITVVNPTPGGGTSNAQTFTISAVPTISSLNPTCTAAGGPQFTLAVNGTNFVSGSTVRWSGTALATAGSGTQLTATVPAALIATAGTASITVVTPCGATSNAQTFTIVDAPVITSPLTACGTRNVAFSYTITATNNPTSFTASPLPAGLTVNTSTGVISGTPTTNGTTTVTITARNGAGPCNTTSATLVITIGSAPTISSLNPNCTGAGGPQFTLTVNGTNFVSTSTVNWNGSPLATTFVSSTRLTATVPASLIATPGTASVTVGTCATNSSAATFTISTVPTISSLNPTCASAGDNQFTLTVNGSNFVSTSIVNWNGAALTTTFFSSTQLTATVPANNISNPGTASITVVSPCGGTSNAVTFPIDNPPSITSALTASATVGTFFSYQITANNNPISYDAEGLPGGLAVDTTTGIISGPPTATGTFPVTISATNNGSDPCSGTAMDTLQLTVTFPGGVFIPPFLGQVDVFGWGPTPPPADATIPFPNASTNNSFVLVLESPWKHYASYDR